MAAPLPSEMVDRAPARLGPFDVHGILGEGGGGVVYAAERDGRKLALKVPHAERELSDADRRRFIEEARLMERVEHPGVVRVLDAGMLDDGRPFVAMERLEGETLAERVSRQGPLALAEAMALFAQLCEATAALHDRDLVHRDLKAENVFLVDGGRRAKLLDFGIAKDRSAPQHATTTGIVRGTPATMAPERFFGAAATEASDVYELTVMLYVMLAGRLPWAGEETDIDARLHPLALRQVGIEVPDALSQEIMRGLSSRPELRPQSARELSDRVRLSATAAASGGLSGPTVTSENLRALVEHRTPLGTAVTSSPRPRTTAPDRLLPRLPAVLGVGALAAAVALGIGALGIGAFGAEGQGAPALTASLSPPALEAATAVEDQLARTAASASEADAADDAASAVEPEAVADAADEAPPRPARKAPARLAPAASKPATALAEQPEASAPIPGGVYDKPPY